MFFRNIPRFVYLNSSKQIDLKSFQVGKRYLNTVKNTVAENVPKTENLLNKPTKKIFGKIVLLLTVLPSGAFFTYYQLALNHQEKRKIRVKFESAGRAIR